MLLVTSSVYLRKNSLGHMLGTHSFMQKKQYNSKNNLTKLIIYANMVSEGYVFLHKCLFHPRRTGGGAVTVC